jgi:hypothetical protein
MVGERAFKCSGQARSKGGFHCFYVQTKLEPLLFAHFKIVKNGLELRKLQPPKIEGSKTQKKIKMNSQASKNVFLLVIFSLLLFIYTPKIISRA